jgi:hypothetical protein
MWFLGFFNHKKGVPRHKILKWSTVCSTFARSGWSIVRSASLTNGSSLEKRPSLHLYKAPTWSNKVGPQTLQMALIYKLLKQRALLQQTPSIQPLHHEEFQLLCTFTFARKKTVGNLNEFPLTFSLVLLP